MKIDIFPLLSVLIIILGLLFIASTLPDGTCEARTPGMTETEYEEYRLEREYEADGVIITTEHLYDGEGYTAR